MPPTAPPAAALRIYTTTDYQPRTICHWPEQIARLRWKVENGDLLLAIARHIRARSGPVAIYLVDDPRNPGLQDAMSLAQTGAALALQPVDPRTLHAPAP